MDDALLDDALNGDFWAEEESWNPPLKAEVATEKEHEISEASVTEPLGVDLEMLQERVGFVSARVPVSLKYRYDDHVARGKLSNARLARFDKAEAMICLLTLLDDPQVREQWLAIAVERTKR